MQISLRAEAVVDLSAASDTTAFTIKAPGAGSIALTAVFGRFEEAVATGGFTSTAGVASLEVAGVEYATWSTGVTSTARSIGDTILMDANATALALGGNVNFAAGDEITLKTKTAGTGGTVTGTIRFNLPLDINLG